MNETPMLASGMLPKIELHVHLEGTIRAHTLLTIARRNGLPLPADTVEGLAQLYEFRDFGHFLEVWTLTTNCLRTAEDFRQVVVDYAAEACRSCRRVHRGHLLPRRADQDRSQLGCPVQRLL